ncbi:hypothetical protein [Saccharothrix hoggarensis]|uniref:Uncharacterized protein n=1 Tax=Saccharothrix hoggarensis TaxID=913853 RepID=A0ABW3R4S9_9PSEU
MTAPRARVLRLVAMGRRARVLRLVAMGRRARVRRPMVTVLRCPPVGRRLMVLLLTVLLLTGPRSRAAASGDVGEVGGERSGRAGQGPFRAVTEG